MDAAQISDIRHRLDVRGYAVVPKFLSGDVLEAIHKLRTTGGGSCQPHLGTVAGIEKNPQFQPIILFEQQYRLLAEIGFPSPRFFAGYFISKPPGGPRLHWHQDWWAWSDPISYARSAPIVYLMYYLSDTNSSNGSLRVLPGSHLHLNELHALLRDRPTHPSQPLPVDDISLSTRSDEIEVSVSAGDLILRDGRLLHASHANLSNENRDLLVLSFVPKWSELSEELQCAFDRKRPKIERHWPPSQAESVLSRATVYSGPASPTELKRTPDLRHHEVEF